MPLNEGRNTVIEVLLFGSLWREGQPFPTRQVQMELQNPTPLPDLLERFRIGGSQVQLAMVNYKAVPPYHRVRPGDRVSLFPKEYPIFADWKNFRS
jgi:sulfur carrier protein ThiS